jgi:Met-zincin
MATIEEVLVPLYLHHRYQVEAAASSLGGLHFTYAMRGDGRDPIRPASAAEQRAALDAVLATLRPSELALPRELLKKIPPRPSGFGNTRELFPRYTGQMFDAIAPAVVAANLTIGYLLNDARAARLVQQHALDTTLPGLDTVIDQLVSATFGAEAASAYESEIARAVQRVVVEHLMTLASDADMPQVRAIASQKLQQRQQRLTGTGAPTNTAAAAHAALLAADIKRFLDRPYAPATRREIPTAPPGAPIGEPGMDWLGTRDLGCSWK